MRATVAAAAAGGDSFDGIEATETGGMVKVGGIEATDGSGGGVAVDWKEATDVKLSKVVGAAKAMDASGGDSDA